MRNYTTYCMQSYFAAICIAYKSSGFTGFEETVERNADTTTPGHNYGRYYGQGSSDAAYSLRVATQQALRRGRAFLALRTIRFRELGLPLLGARGRGKDEASYAADHQCGAHEHDEHVDNGAGASHHDGTQYGHED